MSAEAGAAPSPTSGDSAIARIPGTFFAPSKTFEAIARRPTWILPVAIWIVLSLAISAVLLPRMDFEKMVRDRIEKSGQKVSDEQLQSIVARQKSFAPIFSYVIGGLAPLVITLVCAVVIWGAFKAFGWDLTYAQSLGVTSHGFLPGVLGAVLLLPLLARQETMDPNAMGDLLRSNLGFLVGRDEKVLHSLLSSIDLFSFWSLALFVIGYSIAAKVRKGQAAGVIVTLWVVFVLGKAGLAAVF